MNDSNFAGVNCTETLASIKRQTPGDLDTDGIGNYDEITTYNTNQSFEEFQGTFQKAAMTRFGSGWAWLGVKDNSLCVCSSPNQDNPLMDGCCTPILGLDVWEHAYYKKYGPGRATYIEAWWNVVDWNEVSRRYAEAL